MNTNSKQVWTQVWVKNSEEVDDSIDVYVNMEPSPSAKLIKRMLLDIILNQDKLRKKINWRANDNATEERKIARLRFLAKQEEKRKNSKTKSIREEVGCRDRVYSR